MEHKLEERWDHATNELIEKLEKHNIDFSQLNAIELFGRDGTWQTKIFSKKVKNIEIWEVDPYWKSKLEKNFPNSKIAIQDSIDVLNIEKNLPKFDLILIDNPMNVYRKLNGENMYCEHFDIIQNINKISQDESLVIFNVNRKPFDYIQYPLWEKRRNEFYQRNDTDNMEISFLINFYEKKFDIFGFKTIFNENVVGVICNGDNMTYYFAYKLKKY